MNVTQTFFAAIQAGDEIAIKACLTPDFVFEDETAVATWETQGFLQWVAALKTALPDLRVDVLHEGSKVAVAYEGTHRGELDLTLLGAGYAPASGDIIRLAPQDHLITIEGGRIASVVALAGNETGIGGLLLAVGTPGVLA